MRWIIWIGIVGLVLVGFGIFLPQLLSVQMVQQSVVNLINQRIAPSELAMERWRLSWRGPMQLQGVSYVDQSRGVSLETPEITTSKGLAALLTRADDAGQLRVVTPVVRLDAGRLAAKRNGTGGSTSPQASKTAEVKAANASAPSETSDPAGAIPFSGRIIIEDGRVIATGGDGQPDLLLAQKIDIDTALKPGQVYPFSFSALASDGKGGIAGDGSAKLAADKPRLESVNLDSKWQLKAWPIEALLQMAAIVDDAPRGAGVVSGNWRLSASPDAGIGAKGEIEAQNVVLSGGPFQSDQPEFENLQIRFDITQDKRGIKFNHLDMTTIMAQLQSTGTLSDPEGDQGSFTVTGRVVLPELFAQLPATLRLKPGMRISSGELTLKANARLADEMTHFEATVSMKDLKGLINGGSVALESPVTAVASGVRSKEITTIEQLRLQSSFAEIEGGGTPQRFKLTGTADVAQLLREAGKFFEIDGWAGRGQMTLGVNIEPRGQGRRLAGSAHITGFELAKGKQPIFDKQDFGVETEAELAPQGYTSAVFNALVLNYQGGMGAGQVRAEQVTPVGKDRPLAIKGLTHTGRVDLGVLSRAMQAFGAAAELRNLTGTADLDLTLDAQAQQIGPFEARINIERMGGTWSGKRFTDPMVQINTRGAIDTKGQEMTLAPLEIDFSAGKAHFDKLTLSNWKGEHPAMTSRGMADIDLDRLRQQFGALMGMSATATLSGRADLNWKAALKPDGFAEVALTAAPLLWKQNQTTLFDNESLTVSVKLKGDFPVGDINIETLQMDSQILVLNANGNYAVGDNASRLDLAGDIKTHLSRFSETLTKTLKTEIVAQDAGGPFQISIGAAEGQWAGAWKTMVAETALAIERISGYGITLEQLKIPLQMDRGVASAHIEGSVSQGKVQLNPTANLTATPAAVTFPENTMVLKSVALTQEMLSGLLAKIHPLFKGAVVGQGNIDLNFNHLYWPLDQALQDQASFKGNLRFNDTRLTSSPLLDLLLALVKSDGRSLDLSGQELTFTCRQGRIHSDPITVTVKSHPVTLVGSMGLDNSLDYMASVPITEELVGKAAYPLLNESLLKVPIAGTVSKPRIDLQSFKTELKAVTTQAGKRLVEEKAGEWLKKLFD